MRTPCGLPCCPTRAGGPNLHLAVRCNWAVLLQVDTGRLLPRPVWGHSMRWVVLCCRLSLCSKLTSPSLEHPAAGCDQWAGVAPHPTQVGVRLLCLGCQGVCGQQVSQLVMCLRPGGIHFTACCNVAHCSLHQAAGETAGWVRLWQHREVLVQGGQGSRQAGGWPALTPGQLRCSHLAQGQGGSPQLVAPASLLQPPALCSKASPERRRSRLPW